MFLYKAFLLLFMFNTAMAFWEKPSVGAAIAFTIWVAIWMGIYIWEGKQLKTEEGPKNKDDDDDPTKPKRQKIRRY